MAKHEPKAPNRLPKDFNHMKPDDVQITDPDRAENEAAGIPVDREYPKHLHRFVGHGQMHEYVEVTDAKSEAAAKREGYVSIHEANAAAREAQGEIDAVAKPKGKTRSGTSAAN